VNLISKCGWKSTCFFNSTVEPLLQGHPWDWKMLSVIERCPDYRGQIE
jgi:hypothetical protein